MDKFFKLKENGTNVKTEALAGLTTFLTMAYVIFVNPIILSQAGMDKGAVFVATILAAVIGTFIMGFVANVPFALAPGMGLNAFFTFTVVFGLGFTWQQALAMVFICGIINIIITVTNIRKMIIVAIPESLQYAISGGIGLFIAYIGVKQAHFLQFTGEAVNKVAALGEGGVFNDVVPAMVNFKDPVAQLALIGLIITIVLMILEVKSSILVGILATTVIGIFFGVTQVPASGVMNFDIPSLSPTLFKLDFAGLFSDPGKIFLALTTIFAFSLTDTFDTIGTFLGAGKKSGIFDNSEDYSLAKSTKGFSSKLERALFADATATSIGALLGTSNTTTYVESTAGISQGGRTGLASVVTGILFLLCLFIAPIAGMVPGAATAPALIVVGILMAESLQKIEWSDLEIAIPAFFTIAFMPFTYSITNGVAAGFIFYCIAKLLKKKGKEVHPILYIVTVLFILSYLISAVV
ncbi:AGZA family xanthine/uracil permease-like MFS transporter [Clostridium punense]|uniref:AGZA family xanthine/uracil permease-like MFS transporter n=1 Tax=Clostridium punense TaxID=1054297 RepID=A0ABS4K6T4_9CLOT|nr:NCS2 family permease [Clostridium sp. BL8]MBP2023493.1 AGZA family xanthine/uracil permease-like MFS transporter [Clostridium punense]